MLREAIVTIPDSVQATPIREHPTCEVLLVLSVDGKGIAMRTEALRPATTTGTTHFTSIVRVPGRLRGRQTVAC